MFDKLTYEDQDLEPIDALSLFKREINSYPVIPVGPENYLELGPDEPTRRSNLLLGNLRLGLKTAYSFKDQGEDLGIPFVDLLQESETRLWKASARYQPESGYQFSTFATVAIKRKLWTVLDKQRRRLRRLSFVPFSTIDNPEEEGRNPEIQETRYVNPHPENPLFETLKAETRKEIDEGLDKIKVIAETMIRLRYGLDDSPGMTLEEVGKKFGFTKERARQIINQGLEVLRNDPELRKAFNH